MESLVDKNLISQALREIYHEISKRYVVKSRGASMLPFIKEGSRVVIQYTRATDIKIGDIIAFRRTLDVAIHRIVGKYTRNGKVYLIEKGDNAFYSTMISEYLVIRRVVQIKTARVNIRLNQGLWVAINRIMGTYGYIGTLLFSKISFIRTQLVEEEKTFLATLAYKILKILNSCIPILLFGMGRLSPKRS